MSEKRKIGDNKESSTIEFNKKSRTEVSNNNGKFTEDCLPDGIFPIGDDVFITVSSYHNSVVVHIRRFKKYGKTFYPTPEGITLAPWWIEYIMKKVPESQGDLPNGLFPPTQHIQIRSENFTEFTFKRIKYGLDKKTTFKEIVISRDQWLKMSENYDAIENTIIDKMYQCMDLLTANQIYCDDPIQKTLLPSSDVSLGEQYAIKILKKSICILFNERGLKPPQTLAKELWGNRVETFNSFALSLEANDLAECFYGNLFENEQFLLLKPVNYVTEEFFENLRLDVILKEVRNMLCPPNCFEYYENFPRDFI